MSTALSIEFSKNRHLRLTLLAVLFTALVIATTAFTTVGNPDFAADSPRAWDALLVGTGGAFMLLAPLTLAVIASRQMEIEHRDSGWLLFAGAGVPPGQLWLRKLAVSGILVTAATVAACGLAAAFGIAVGIASPAPVGRWLGLTVAVAAVNLVVLTVQTALSTVVSNQLVAVGVGLLGTVIALFGSSVPAWLARLTPWGHYALAAAAEYRDTALVPREPAHLSIAALLLVTGLGAALFIRHLNRKEL